MKFDICKNLPRIKAESYVGDNIYLVTLPYIKEKNEGNELV